jgi:DNA-binding Lrp family transcriptional regulator
MATLTTFEPSTLDREILKLLHASPDGIPLPALADRLYPAWSPQWTRERVRRLKLVGLVDIDTTRTPSIVHASRRA